MLRFPQLGKLVVLKYASGFKDYLSAGLSCGSMSCFISCVPHAHSNCDNELMQFFSHMLYKDGMPNKVHEFPSSVRHECLLVVQLQSRSHELLCSPKRDVHSSPRLIRKLHIRHPPRPHDDRGSPLWVVHCG